MLPALFCMVSYYSIPFAASKAEDFDADPPGHKPNSNRVYVDINEGLPAAGLPSNQTSAVSYYGSLGGRGLKRAGIALSAADAAVRGGQAGLQSLQRRQALGSLNAARSVEELQSVLNVRLSELDGFSCTVALHRLARLSHDVDKGAAQRTQRQWRDALAAKVRSHPSWPILMQSVAASLHEAEPRQLANMAWAVARLRAEGDGQHLLRSAAIRCAERTGPGSWDAMSTSLIPWSFATLTADIRGKEVQELVRSVGRLVHEEGSTFWTPGDLSRVAWSWAKLTQKDDTFFRRCSCLVIARLPEYTPSQLAQTIWAFATAAPSDACTHLLPKAAAAMLEGGDSDLRGLHAYTPQHLAMAVWSFAAVLYRPEELLKQIGEAVPYKLEKLNPQDISTTAWAFTTLLAKDRTIYDVLAATSIRTIHDFNNQDLSNTVWAFASAGEYHADLLEAIAAETCQRPDFHGQHLAMVAWAFITLRHRHDQLLYFIGEMTNGSKGLGTWSNAKLLAFTFAGLPRLGDALLGTEKWTLGAMQRLLDHFHAQLKNGPVDADDAWVVHDAVLPWLELDSRMTQTIGWQALTRMLSEQREALTGFLGSEEFQAILASEKPKETSIIRRYQESVQAFRIRGLGSEHSWRFLSRLGVLRSTEKLVIGSEIRCLKHMDGRGERQNWCYFRSSVSANGLLVREPGRLLNSTVVKYREDCAGLVHVKLHHDRVDHRAWDAEFRAMARTAAAARTLLGDPDGVQQAQELLANGARTGDEIPCSSFQGDEAQVEGLLELFMTEVPCLSCMCAMAQFRRRFPRITLRVLWDGLPPEAHFG